MRKAGQKARPDIVSVHLSPEAKQDLDDVCDLRGMTIKTLLGRLIEWFVVLDKTEQSVVLGQVEDIDVRQLAEIISRRHARGVGDDLAGAIREARANQQARKSAARA
ncbi:MAG: hypothetical protein HRF50_06660 [Phycisphaerae bacterium]|jgi:hypothetical protein